MSCCGGKAVEQAVVIAKGYIHLATGSIGITDALRIY